MSRPGSQGEWKRRASAFRVSDSQLVVTLTILAATLALATPPSGLRATVVLVFVLIAPGYALTSAMLPRRSTTIRSGIKGVDRVALAIGLSVSILPILAFAQNATPVGLDVRVSVIALASGTLILTLIAHHRRRRTPLRERYDPRFTFARTRAWFDTRHWSRPARSFAVAVVLLVAGVATVTALPRWDSGFTTMTLQDAEGGYSNFTESVTLNEVAQYIVVIDSHESVTTAYRLDMIAERGVWVRSDTRRSFDLHEREPVKNWSFTLDPGAGWRVETEYVADSSWNYRIAFELSRADAPTTVYRRAYAWLNVEGERERDFNVTGIIIHGPGGEGHGNIFRTTRGTEVDIVAAVRNFDGNTTRFGVVVHLERGDESSLDGGLPQLFVSNETAGAWSMGLGHGESRNVTFRFDPAVTGTYRVKFELTRLTPVPAEVWRTHIWARVSAE